MTPKTNFRSRTLASFILLFSFTILAVSGVILFLRPEGNIAQWTGWYIWGLNKQSWEGLHTLFSVLFVFSSLFHLLFNWRILLSYLKGLFKKGFRYSREFGISVLITSMLLVISLWKIDPFWKLIDLRAYIKKGSQTINFVVPNPDYVNFPLTKIAADLNISMLDLVIHIKQEGYLMQDSTQSIMSIAKLNEISPEKFYMNIFDAPRITP